MDCQVHSKEEQVYMVEYISIPSTRNKDTGVGASTFCGVVAEFVNLDKFKCVIISYMDNAVLN